MDYKRHQRLKKCRIRVSIYQIGNLNDFIYTFRFVRRNEGVVRAVVDMDYVTGDKLGNLVRLGFVLEVQFTYVVRSVQHITILLQHVQRTLDDVQDSWARVVCGDGLAGANLSDGCHQVVRFVGREVFIEPVELHVFVLVVRAALDASLRKLDVLE